MVRKLTLVIGLAMSLLGARDAWAVSITPTDLDTWTEDRFFLRSHTDQFRVTHPPFVIGELTTTVFFDGSGEYTYVLRATHSMPIGGFSDGPFFFTQFGNTTDPFARNQFGFTGVAGWSFSDAHGGDHDFLIGLDDVFTGQLGWSPHFFFWVRANLSGQLLLCFHPASRDGHLRACAPFTVTELTKAEQQGLAPVPDPGSIALLGSGLVDRDAAVRRRRSPKA